ncbi:helicase-related protein [Gemmiger gallinarum]|uniref:helicase-related protein n=1 Tax=Gemmiger gallinarum TaxID=2779354 RepID=UPI0038B32395
MKYVSKGEKTLVYCPYRSQVDSIYGALPTEYKIKIRRYHSKIHDAERKITERDYSCTFLIHIYPPAALL